MKNRYIPFGYQIQNGDSVINTEQAATVQHIFYAYTEGQSFKEIAEYLTTSGTAYHFSDNSWNKNIVARILANEIYCGAKGYPAIISKEVYSQAASIRSNKTVTYSAVLKPFRSDMQCACCGERLYWRPRTQQWTCRQCGMWSKPMQPENMAQQIVDRLYQIQQHPEIHALQLHGLVGQTVRHVQHFFNAVDPAQYRHRRPPGRWTSWKNGSEWFPARSGPYQPGPAEGPVWYSSLKNPFWNQSGGMTAASPQAHTGARCGLAAFLGGGML